MKTMIALGITLLPHLAAATDPREAVADDLLSSGRAPVYREHRAAFEGEAAPFEDFMWNWAKASPDPNLRRASLDALPHSANALARLDEIFAMVDEALDRGDEDSATRALRAAGRIADAHPNERHRVLGHYDTLPPAAKAFYLDHQDELKFLAPATYPKELADLLDAEPILSRKAFALGLDAERFEGPHVRDLVMKMAGHLERLESVDDVLEHLDLIVLGRYAGHRLDPLLPVLRNWRLGHEDESVRSAAEYALFTLRGAGARATLATGVEKFRHACGRALVRASGY